MLGNLVRVVNEPRPINDHVIGKGLFVCVAALRKCALVYFCRVVCAHCYPLWVVVRPRLDVSDVLSFHYRRALASPYSPARVLMALSVR